jgi:hypothetical protein
MKYSGNPEYNKLEKRHIEIGSQALDLGLKQIGPGVLACCGAYYLYRKWSDLS